MPLNKASLYHSRDGYNRKTTYSCFRENLLPSLNLALYPVAGPYQAEVEACGNDEEETAWLATSPSLLQGHSLLIFSFSESNIHGIHEWPIFFFLDDDKLYAYPWFPLSVKFLSLVYLRNFYSEAQFT